jgi:hypothetical protein
LTAKNYESNAELDLSRHRPDPIADLKSYSSIYLPPDDFRQSLLTSPSKKLKSARAKSRLSKLELIDRRAPELSGFHSPISPRLANGVPLTPSTPTQKKPDAPFFESQLAVSSPGLKRDSKTTKQHKEAHLSSPKEGNTQKTQEKLMYLFSPEHRSSLRREEKERELDNKQKTTTNHVGKVVI